LDALHGPQEQFEPFLVGIERGEQSSPTAASFWGSPVRSALVRLAQNGYKRSLAISKMPPR